MKTKRNILFKVLIIISILLGICFIYSYRISYKLTVNFYEVETSFEQSIRIVQLTDLHNAEFGQKNSKLVELVENQSPDFIVMTGDMLNRDDENLDIVTNLISELNKIAPVYYGYGNHETEWETKWNSKLYDDLSNAGAIVLNNEFIDITVNENDLRLAGYMGYYWQPHMMTADKEQQEIERNFYGEFQDTDRYKILLNHIPTQWVDWDYIDVCHVDFVFSGHYHGGMIRIPFWDRGVIAPYVGWFPPYTKGIFYGTEATCVLSSGLGTEYMIPRLNNPPEVVVVDMVPKE